MMVSNHPGVKHTGFTVQLQSLWSNEGKTETAQTTSETLSTHGRRANGAREKIRTSNEALIATLD